MEAVHFVQHAMQCSWSVSPRVQLRVLWYRCVCVCVCVVRADECVCVCFMLLSVCVCVMLMSVCVCVFHADECVCVCVFHADECVCVCVCVCGDRERTCLNSRHTCISY